MAQRLLLPDGAIKIMPPDLPGYWMLGENFYRQGRSVLPASGPQRKSNRLSFAEQEPGNVEIVDGSIYVDAPDLPQPTAWSCALVAAAFCRLFGVGPDSVDAFMKGMGTKRSGTNPGGIVSYLKKLDLKPRIEYDLTDIDLMDLLDAEIPSILAIQAYASDPTEYLDPNNCDNGHWVGLIGYSFSAPKIVLPGPQLRGARNATAGRVKVTAARPASSSRIILPNQQQRGSRLVVPSPALLAAGKKPAEKPPAEKWLFFLDTSILCRYGYMTWSNLDRRWHDNAGTRKNPKYVRHMAIIIDPNGHEPIHDRVAQEIM